MADENNGVTLAQIVGAAVLGALAGGSYYAIQKMEDGGRNFDAPPQTPSFSDFEIACEFLDLPKDANFTITEMRARAKDLRRTYHPDTEQSEKAKARLTKISQRIGWAEQVIVNKMSRENARSQAEPA